MGRHSNNQFVLSCLFLALTLFGIHFYRTERNLEETTQSANREKVEEKKSAPQTTNQNLKNASSELLKLEEKYSRMLLPITELKFKEPKTYWFIVSWLGTNYGTPNWTNYNNSEWKELTKSRGIDCSGFARVMQDKIFSRTIRGGSNGILKDYCMPKTEVNLKLGDLVFFKAPYSNSSNIVHVGVYLFEGYFVHATSRKSAAKGYGLSINSLNEKFWAQDFVTGGRLN